MKDRLASNLGSSCFSFLSAGILSMCQCALLKFNTQSLYSMRYEDFTEASDFID